MTKYEQIELCERVCELQRWGISMSPLTGDVWEAPRTENLPCVRVLESGRIIRPIGLPWFWSQPNNWWPLVEEMGGKLQAFSMGAHYAEVFVRRGVVDEIWEAVLKAYVIWKETQSK